jgi:hypothetical protein
MIGRIVQPGQQVLDVGEGCRRAFGRERGASRDGMAVLAGRGGEHSQVLTQVKDIVLSRIAAVRIDVREVGIGAGHQLKLGRGVGARNLGSRDGDKYVELVGLAPGGREMP